jgi:hypothetical protein
MDETLAAAGQGEGQGPVPAGRKVYRPPVLTEYGDLRSLVLAGSAPFPEDSTSGVPRRPIVP